MKVCIKCSIERDDDKFRIRSTGKRENTCRKCMALAGRAWRARNVDRVLEFRRVKYRENKEDLLARGREWRLAHPNYRAPSALLPGYNTERSRRYHAANRLELNRKKQAYTTNKRKTDISFRIAGNFRARLVRAMRGIVRARPGSAIRDLGCTIDQLKAYLERRFQPGMSWGNWARDGWHVDHVTPLAAFDLTNPEQFKTAVHYSNLQPLWAHENHSKSYRMVA